MVSVRYRTHDVITTVGSVWDRIVKKLMITNLPTGHTHTHTRFVSCPLRLLRQLDYSALLSRALGVGGLSADKTTHRTEM